MIKPLPIDDAKMVVNAAKDQKLLMDIRKQGANVWRPAHKGPVCVGCRFADIHVVSVERVNYWSLSGGTHQANELSIYCYSKSRIIQRPYELCTQRQEKPKLTLAEWQH